MSVWIANVSDAIPFHSAIPTFREATWPTNSVVNVMRSIVNVFVATPMSEGVTRREGKWCVA